MLNFFFEGEEFSTTCIFFCVNGKALVLCNQFQFMLAATKVFQFNGHQAAVYNLCHGLTNEAFISCGSDKNVVRWNLNNGEENLLARAPLAAYSVVLNKDASVLAIGLGDGSISFLDLKNKVEFKKLLQHKAAIFDLVFSPKKALYIAASADGSISFIDATETHCKKIIKICNAKIRSLSLSADENTLAVACGDGSIRLFGLDNLQQLSQTAAHKESCNVVIFHPDGKHLLSGGKDALLGIWEIMSDSQLKLVQLIPAHNYAIYSISFHPKLHWFATGSRDKTVKIWDASSFDFLLRINNENHQGHKNSVNKVLWMQQDELLLSTGDDRSIMAWKISEGA